MQRMKGAPGVFPGQCLTHDLLNIPHIPLPSASAEEFVLLRYWLQILTGLNQGSPGEG